MMEHKGEGVIMTTFNPAGTTREGTKVDDASIALYVHVVGKGH